MRWAVIFEDTPEMPQVRRQCEAAHLAYLETHAATIRLAGGLKNGPGENFCGGLWIIETQDRDEATRLIENDPYYRALPRPYRLLLWGNPFPDRKVTL